MYVHSERQMLKDPDLWLSSKEFNGMLLKNSYRYLVPSLRSLRMNSTLSYQHATENGCLAKQLVGGVEVWSVWRVGSDVSRQDGSYSDFEDHK